MKSKMKSTKCGAPSAGRTGFVGLAGIAAATLLVAGGCATTAGGLGDESGPERLPTGIVFLDSVERECTGTLHVGEDGIVSAELRDEVFVDPGQNATFRVRNNSLDWACIQGDERTFGEATCPRDTSHVRFTRALDGESLLVECFGYPR